MGDYSTATGSTMIAIAAGAFAMGTSDYGPIHAVTLTHELWMGQTEVTQDQWLTVMGTAPSSYAGCADCPVEQVDWADAATFTNALSALEGLDACYNEDGTELAAELSDNPYDCDGYRLPTEAEWEYASRAGESFRYAGSDAIYDVVWFVSSSDDRPHDVASLAPNGWGLYDMSGNVWEWTNDAYAVYSSGPVTDPTGASSGSDAVLRGGGFTSAYYNTEIGYRTAYARTEVTETVGFRIARSSTAP